MHGSDASGNSLRDPNVIVSPKLPSRHGTSLCDLTRSLSAPPLSDNRWRTRRRFQGLDCWDVEWSRGAKPRASCVA